VDSGSWQVLLAGCEDSSKSISNESRLASGEADLWSRGVNQGDGFQNVDNEPIVIYDFRRLGTHQAKIVTTLGDKKGIVVRMPPIENSQAPVYRRQDDNISI
jgi:hypothetical protein